MTGRRGARRPRVAVVGAGVSGLAAAWRLAGLAGAGVPDGVDVLVLDCAPRTGGLLRASDVGGVRVDLGAEAMLARRPEAVRLAREIGLGADLVSPVGAAAAIWTGARLRPLPAGTVMGVPGHPRPLCGLLSEHEIARVAAERGRRHPPLAAAPGDGPGTDRDRGTDRDPGTDQESDLDADVAVGPFVAARVGPAVVDRLVEPLLGGVYAGHAARLSLRSTIPALWPAARDGTSLVDRARAVADGVAPGTCAGPVFLGIRGGVARLAEMLAERLAARGVPIRTRCTVRELRRSPAGWRLTLGPAGVPEVLDVDAVLLAVPAPAAARLLGPLLGSAAGEVGAIEVASVAVVVLAVPERVVAAVGGSGILVPPVAGAARGVHVKAVTASSSKWTWVARQVPGTGLLRASFGRAGEARILQRDDADLIALAGRDVGTLLGTDVPVRAGHVARWGGSLPQYAVGHLGKITRLRAAVATQPALAVCGSWLDGVGVAACIGSADAAVASLARSLDTMSP